MKKTALYFTFILLSLNVSGYNDKPPVRWGKILQPEVELKEDKDFKNVPAIILCDFGEIEITNRTMYSRHLRLKILDEGGIEKYSKIEIPYLAKNDYEDIVQLKIQAFHPDENGKLHKRKYGRSAISTSSINSKWNKKVIELEDLKVGSIVEYKYEIASLDFVKLKEWYFQSDIPVLWSEIRFIVPQYFTYLLTYEKGERISTSDQQKYANRLKWLYSEKIKNVNAQLADKKYLLFSSEKGNYRAYVINNSTKKIIMRDLPPIDKKNITFAESPHLSFHLFESLGNLPWFYKPLLMTTKYENVENMHISELYYRRYHAGFINYQLETWKEFNEKLILHENFGKQLIKNLKYEKGFDKINANVQNPYDKMLAIRDYINEITEWNGEYSVFSEKDIDKVKKKGKGSSGEINLLLIHYLRKAGLNARPAVMKTGTFDRVETVYPVKGQFNHTIAVIEIDDKYYILDASGSISKLREMIVPGINDIAWIVHPKEYGWIKISGEQLKFIPILAIYK